MSLARPGPADQHNAIASKPAVTGIRRATVFVLFIAGPPAPSNEVRHVDRSAFARGLERLVDDSSRFARDRWAWS
jgi:hypothetical protein